MRISDWSSDVCSSDLVPGMSEEQCRKIPGEIKKGAARAPFFLRQTLPCERCRCRSCSCLLWRIDDQSARPLSPAPPRQVMKIGSASCRERGCPYVWISVAAGALQKNTKHTHTD